MECVVSVAFVARDVIHLSKRFPHTPRHPLWIADVDSSSDRRNWYSNNRREIRLVKPPSPTGARTAILIWSRRLRFPFFSMRGLAGALPPCLLLCGMLCAPSATGQVEGMIVTDEAARVYQRLPHIENQLYGHGYADQGVSQRLSRIERTLFGTVQRGPSEMRVRRIEGRINEKNNQAALANQEPLLEYLEERFFQRPYKEKSMPERIRQLEIQVFGHPFESYPLPIRMKKLTYAVPITAREIRVAKGDTVLARTGYRSRHASRTAATLDALQLDAGDLGIKKTALPGGMAVSRGDYVHAIHREAGGMVLRWQTLPIKVYVKAGDATEGAMFSKAIQAWQSVFSVTPVSASTQADVIVTWAKDAWAQNTTSLLTRPVIQVDERHNIRTVILISMYPLKGHSARHQSHALMHQLGHAFGLWGHSDDPNDVMYPAFQAETNDFPSRWTWRSAPTPVGAPAGSEALELGQPSQRDGNTLLKIYGLPAHDISAYSPY